MYCIVSYSVLCMYFICYLYIIVLTNVTRKKDIYCPFLLAPEVYSRNVSCAHDVIFTFVLFI